ncbi:P-loop containing nucleoside triphosphate hydrolase protein [Pavlovales sp. CCMP2436]|nr:P-loop containing nucleoside triphosphate hydrolase protein [Pavlovales sp. CCMP2436]
MSGSRTQISGRIGRIIAVHSCKGGVGKSTVAVGLARALQRQEVYPFVSEDGLTCQSFAFVARLWKRRLGEGSVVLQGSLIAELMAAMANHTKWGNLDDLVVDLPPGTGEVPMTLATAFPMDCAVVVTTAHKLAVVDTVKGVEMLQKLGVPVPALVQNMAVLLCSCGAEHMPFGPSAAAELQKRLPNASLLELPIAPDDSGLGGSLDADFDRLAKSLSAVDELLKKGGHTLPKETKQWSIPHWPTLMATAKLELK